MFGGMVLQKEGQSMYKYKMLFVIVSAVTTILVYAIMCAGVPKNYNADNDVRMYTAPANTNSDSNISRDSI